MDRTPVSSSNVASVGYDPDTETLEVGFVKGTVYQYSSVPPEVFEEFMQAASKGIYLNNVIKVRFSVMRIG